MKPPSIILLTPNGRFETFKKICLSISGHHPESWQPSWSIRTALLAIIGFMPTHGGGAIGSLDYTPEERKVLAKRSQDWKCPECGDVSQKLKPKTQASEEAAQEAKELASQINFQGEKQAKTSEEKTATTTLTASDQPIPITSDTPPPVQPTFPWAMPPVWVTAPQQYPGSSAPLTFPRFPYPPPMMLPPSGMSIASSPNINRQRMPRFPPMPLFQPGVTGFPTFQRAGGAATQGTLAQTADVAAISLSQVTQARYVPSEKTSSSKTSEPSPTSSTLATAGATSTTTTPASETIGTVSSTVSAIDADTTADASVAHSASTSASPTADTTTSTNMTSASSTELRQRATASQQHTQSEMPTTSVVLTPQTQWSYSQGTIVLMVILTLAITLLLGRRMYLQYFGKDFQGHFQ
ncbi:uncharacterized protein LOC143297958 isoform X2 [Babylonia areolata]